MVLHFTQTQMHLWIIMQSQGNFHFPFREVSRLHGAFQRALSSKANIIRLYLMHYFLVYFAVALVTYAAKLLSCNSTVLSLHGCRWTAASGCCRSRLVHSFVFICFPSVLSSHLQQGSHTSISEADGTDPGAQMLPGKLSFLSSKHLATISDHLAFICSSLVSLNEAFQ